MAPINPSYVLQNRTDHPAQLFRIALAGLSPAGLMIAGATAPAGGVHAAFGNRLAVTGTTGLTVNVDTGLVYMPNSTAWEGAYAGYNTASYSVTIPTISGTQWRRDYIVARQLDTAVGGGSDTWDIIDVQGTNSSSSPGALPTLPANCVPLAIIVCTPGMTKTNVAGTVVDARQYIAMGGPVPTTSSARPSLSCPEGTMWWETDTNLLGVIVNGAYKYLTFASGAQDTWHALSLNSGWSTVAGHPIPSYKKTPDGLSVQIAGLAQFSTTFTTHQTVATLPAGYHPATEIFLMDAGPNVGGVEIDTAGLVIAIQNPSGGSNQVNFSSIFPLDL